MASRGAILPLLALGAVLALCAASAAIAQVQTSPLQPGGGLSEPLAALTGTTVSGQAMTLIAAVTLLGLAPGLAVMVTCFPFIVTVLSILRQAIGLQQSPPNMLIVSLALFLTWFIMEPVFVEAWTNAGKPLSEGAIDLPTAIETGIRPFRAFMAARLDPDTLRALADLRPETATITTAEQAPLSLLMPSFMLSEVSRAFEIGFLIFLPFLIIDLVVSALLMSMGMMMVPPAIVSLPFKLAFFVVADGWALVSGALVRSYF
jgi:flagellar biosynthetic protein FliP